MKAFIYKVTLSIFLLFLIADVQSQPSVAALQKHDLSWIKSKNDFDQSKFSEAQINLEIANIIQQATFKNTLTKDIEVPINCKALKYLGYKHPNRVGIFGVDTVSANNSVSLNRNLHIYQYDNFYISTESDDAVSQQNVYYAIRALYMLRYRYTKAYQKLFAETSSFKTDHPKLQTFANSNKAFWITFNESATGMAVSYTSFVGVGSFPIIEGKQIDKYQNVPVINIHAKKILGDLATVGSKPIYQNANAKDNYLSYMKEGLIETLVHEMIHRYIDYSYPFDERSATIHAKNGGNEKDDFQPADENAVANTSLSYFMAAGGFTDNLFVYYYKNVFDDNINKLKNNNHYESYGKIYLDAIENKSPREIFKLDILN